MKRSPILGALTLSIALAQTVFAVSAFEPVPSLPVTGTMAINYRTRTTDNRGKENITDVYTLNVNIANSAVFRGTIEQLPFISKSLSSDQIGKLFCNLDLDVVNPANPKQTKNVGKMFGSAPIDKANIYRFGAGAGIVIAVEPVGAAKGFESRFNGNAYAKPPAASGLAKIKQDSVRLVSGK